MLQLNDVSIKKTWKVSLRLSLVKSYDLLLLYGYCMHMIAIVSRKRISS